MRRTLLLAVMLGLASAALAAPPVTMTADEDHRAMMRELGITSLRPGFMMRRNSRPAHRHGPSARDC